LGLEGSKVWFVPRFLEMVHMSRRGNLVGSVVFYVGHQPRVLVWETTGSNRLVADLSGHKFGIAGVVFNGRILVSIGFQACFLF
jgi:hypothetical protein